VIFSTLQLHVHPDLLQDPTLDQINLWLEAISSAEARQLTRGFLVWTEADKRGELLKAALPGWTRTDGTPLNRAQPYECSASCARGIDEAVAYNLVPIDAFNRDISPIYPRLRARIDRG
jgi:hypothetical protein